MKESHHNLTYAAQRVVQEILDNDLPASGLAPIGEETWASLAAEFEDRQLMDIVFTVGAYDVLAMALRSFAVPLDDDLLP